MTTALTERPACAGMDVGVFYPDDHRNRDVLARYYRAAKQVCAACPVRAACLTEALEQNDQWGVWGGTTPKERALLRKGQR